jgi:hypothetical protein
MTIQEHPVAETKEFFESYLPKKIADHPELASSVKASFLFEITGAGSWSLDLTNPPGQVTEGAMENPGVTITVSKEDWEKLLDNPGIAMQLFMMQKLKVKGNVGLAMQLQKILG